MTQAIRFDRLSFSYTGNPEHNVLNEVSLSLEPGRVSVITGPSGCGKSTLLYIAAGLYPEHSGVITHGTCTFGDLDITAMPAEERSRAIRMVFQNPELQFCFDLVRQEMIFVMENAGIDPDEMMARMDEALQLVGLGGYADRSIRTLSGGEKQRLNLAAQWMIGTQWLLLDEIFTQIDPPRHPHHPPDPQTHESGAWCLYSGGRPPPWALARPRRRYLRDGPRWYSHRDA